VALRIGVDLVSVADVDESVRRYDRRYLERVYTDGELEQSGREPARLAARFAAKEAVMKVLRPAADDAVPWRSIEIRRTPGGWVEVSLHGRAKELAERDGLDGWSISLTHETGYAAAMAAVEVRG
jgi:holo-[acyl-carrier protein] synthase